MFVVGLGIGMFTTMTEIVQKNTAGAHGDVESYGLLEWGEKELERRQKIAELRKAEREVRRLRKEMQSREDKSKELPSVNNSSTVSASGS